MLDELGDWRERHAKLEIELVVGNHDQGAGGLPNEWRIKSHHEPAPEPPFVYAHYPDPHEGGYILAGHLHPAVTLKGQGHQRMRLPCFWFGAHVGVLPAFGEFTGCANIAPIAGDRVFVVADAEVLEVAAQ